MEYNKFIESKIDLNSARGFDINASDISAKLFPHQRDIVRWAIAGGCRAIFAAFGLGKTYIQVEMLRLIHQRHGGRCLIIAPLGVRQEFTRDGRALNIKFQFIRRNAEIDNNYFYITNYESIRDGKLDPNQFDAVSLDEASVLRSFGSKTYQEFLTLFKTVQYRFVCTATPSPNRFKELIHYAGFLGIMDTGQALTRFFQRDSTKANNLTPYPHKEKEFWLWISTWAIFLQRPSDIGYSDDGYVLPDLHVHYHETKTQQRELQDRNGQSLLLAETALSLQYAAKEKRISIDGRIAKMMEIISEHPTSNFILWHDQEAERHAIKKALPAARAVYGSLDLETREQRIIDFSDGKYQYLATKPVLSGSGCNFQRHCNHAIFLGIGFKFNDFIQAVHRIYRFLQTHECHIHLIHTDAERLVLETLQSKWEQHKKMVSEMTTIIKKYGLNHSEMEAELRRTIGVERIEVAGRDFIVANNDCVGECDRIDDNSIDLIHTSIPFSNHYEYSPSYNDFGHNENNDRFFDQMNYLTPNLLRILKPGRVAAIHVKDRVLFGNVTGYGMPSVDPFHAICIDHYRRHGFIYFGMITVVTDVVRENNQTYRLGWSEQCKDGSKMGVGSPEYVLLFRKLPTDTTRSYADEPVKKSKKEYTRARWQVDAHSLWRSSGNRQLTAEEMSAYPIKQISKLFTEQTLKNIYDYEHHVRLGEELDIRGSLPSTFMTLAPGSHDDNVWHDINRMFTLNSSQSKKGQQNHICPLQFDIVDRIIIRFSNPMETVFDPFGGIMTVPYRALKLDRKARASELNTQYFFDGVAYLKAAEHDNAMPDLFGFEEITIPPAAIAAKAQ